MTVFIGAFTVLKPGDARLVLGPQMVLEKFAGAIMAWATTRYSAVPVVITVSHKRVLESFGSFDIELAVMLEVAGLDENDQSLDFDSLLGRKEVHALRDALELNSLRVEVFTGYTRRTPRKETA